MPPTPALGPTPGQQRRRATKRGTVVGGWPGKPPLPDTRQTTGSFHLLTGAARSPREFWFFTSGLSRRRWQATAPGSSGSQ